MALASYSTFEHVPLLPLLCLSKLPLEPRLANRLSSVRSPAPVSTPRPTTATEPPPAWPEKPLPLDGAFVVRVHQEDASA